jgi:hypothetical protein
MDWYIVVKTINGHRYRYRQKTWREGKRVRTQSEYIGPAGDDGSAKGGRGRPTEPTHPDLAGATTLTLPFGKKTSKPKLFDKAIARESLRELVHTDTSSVVWRQHWDAGRRGPSLVKKIPRIEKVLKRLNVIWTHEKRGCFYSPSFGNVNIPPASRFADMDGQTATQAYYVVVFHELVHWSGDRGRINRLESCKYEEEELVAELGAVMFMKHFGLGIGYLPRHAHYFQVWLDRTSNKKRALVHARREAERAVRFILDRGIITT